MIHALSEASDDEVVFISTFPSACRPRRWRQSRAHDHWRHTQTQVIAVVSISAIARCSKFLAGAVHLTHIPRTSLMIVTVLELCGKWKRQLPQFPSSCGMSGSVFHESPRSSLALLCGRAQGQPWAMGFRALQSGGCLQQRSGQPAGMLPAPKPVCGIATAWANSEAPNHAVSIQQ